MKGKRVCHLVGDGKESGESRKGIALIKNKEMVISVSRNDRLCMSMPRVQGNVQGGGGGKRENMGLEGNIPYDGGNNLGT